MSTMREIRGRKRNLGRERNRARVRQRVSHRFHDRLLFCRSSASRSVENGDSRGRCYRQEKFGRKSVTITRQTSGKNLWYRLIVESGSRNWSVILNEEHLSWLQGVLQTAAMKRWYFPSCCTKRVLGQVIHVGKTRVRHEELLQISEQTANGRVFKVLIPVSGTKVGWAGLIKMLQDFYKTELQSRLCSAFDPVSLLPPPAPLQFTTIPGRTYAEVVRGGGFYGAGSCSIKGSGINRYIEVGAKGIAERKELLGRSLVINFTSAGSEVFRSSFVAEFRAWASKTWAINDNFGFIETADGNWLLICPSVSEALRIKELSHLLFKDFYISISPWMEDVTHRNSDDTWILVFGIPLHLKSVDLLVTIGNFCGSFIEVDWNSWSLDFVRIRIRKIRKIPESVLLLAGSVGFTARVVVSPTASDSSQGMGKCESSIQFGKTNRSSSVFPARISPSSNVQLVSPRSGGKAVGILSSRDPIPNRCSPTRVWVRKASPSGLGRSLPSLDRSLLKPVTSQPYPPFSVPPSSPFPNLNFFSLLTNLFCWPESPFPVWLSLDLRETSLLRISFPYPAPPLSDILLSQSSNSISNPSPFHPALPSSIPQEPLPGQLRLCFPTSNSSLVVDLSMASFPSSPPSSSSLSSWDSPMPPSSSPPTFVPETPTPPSSPPSGFSELPSPSCNTGGDQPRWILEQYPFNSVSLVNCTKDLSNLFGLEQGEGQGNLDDILASVAVSMHKRKIKTSRSKLEMERRRLGPSSPPPSGPRRCKKAPGVVSSLSLP
ncbi:unnamed protein product [Linum trigynum]|uniref:DUF4283 domain-containing protein n=1 Tax=Linum trigynum TaxID=586398 RepID=A0AAV2CH46_9ROSI